MSISHAEYKRARRRANREAGLCAWCADPSTGYLCAACKASHVDSVRRWLGLPKRTRVDTIRIRAGRMYSIRPKSVVLFGSDPNGGHEFDFLRDVAITRTKYPAMVPAGSRPSRDYHCGKRTPHRLPFAVKFVRAEVVDDPIVGVARVATFVITSERPVTAGAWSSKGDIARTLAILGPEGTLEGSL